MVNRAPIQGEWLDERVFERGLMKTDSFRSPGASSSDFSPSAHQDSYLLRRSPAQAGSE